MTTFTHHVKATVAGVSFLTLSATLIGHSTVGGSDIRQSLRACVPASCEIALTRVASLPDGGRRLHTPALNVVQDGSGRFFARSLNSGQIVVFGRDGRFETTIAAGIEAPRVILMLRSGHQGSVMAWLVPNGPAYRVDLGLKLTPWGGSVPYLPEVLRPDGSAIVAQQIQTAEHAGYPLHLVAANGRVVRSFGLDVAEYRSDLSLLLERIVAPASKEGTLWAAPRGKYTIERWDPATGQRVQSTSVRSTWFVESGAPRRDETSKPTALFTALWERDGLIWTLVRDVAPDWKPPAKTEQPWSVQSYNMEHDWVIEVVDPESGRVLATRRSAFALARVPPHNLLASYALTQTGVAAGVDIWQPELVRKEKQ